MLLCLNLTNRAQIALPQVPAAAPIAANRIMQIDEDFDLNEVPGLHFTYCRPVF